MPINRFSRATGGCYLHYNDGVSHRSFILDEVPQLSRFNGENCACANGIAKQRYIITLPLRNTGVAQINDGHSLRRLVCSICTAILTLYNYYPVSMVELFPDIVFQCDSVSIQAVLP